MVINKTMNLRRRMYFKWIKFLGKIQDKLSNILEEHEPHHPSQVWPLTMNEWYEFEYEPRKHFKRIHYQNKLNELKEEVKKTLMFNNYRLTHSQILELEDIKRNLKILN
jgi:hypothetical protein